MAKTDIDHELMESAYSEEDGCHYEKLLRVTCSWESLAEEEKHLPVEISFEILSEERGE